MQVDLGPVGDIPEDRCIAVGDGAAVVFRSGTEVRAFSGACLHQSSSLAGGWIRDGVLSCPLHFWRYDIEDGRLIGSTAGRALVRYPVTQVDGRCHVEVPEPDPVRSIRDHQLEHAARWKAANRDPGENDRGPEVDR